MQLALQSLDVICAKHGDGCALRGALIARSRAWDGLWRGWL